MEENIETIKKSGLNKTWILVAGLVILTAILLVVSITSKNNSPLSSSPRDEKTIIAHTSMTVSEDLRNLGTLGAYETDITINTDKDEISGAQIELSYDPKVLTNVDIKPGSFIKNPTELIKTIDIKNGVIRYALAIKPSEKMVKGMGTIAVLSFTKTGTEETAISFLPQSQVSTLGLSESVLSETVSAFITGTQQPSASPTK